MLPFDKLRVTFCIRVLTKKIQEILYPLLSQNNLSIKELSVYISSIKLIFLFKNYKNISHSRELPYCFYEICVLFS